MSLLQYIDPGRVGIAYNEEIIRMFEAEDSARMMIILSRLK